MTESLSERCGQMLVVGLVGRELSTDERRAFGAGLRGGVVLFRRNVGEEMRAVAELVRDVRDATSAETPPLIAVDQEGGRVMRLRAPALPLPPMRTIGDLGDPTFAATLAEAQALELRALGFTMSFAPVVDIHTRPENPIIGDRAFAESPENVATFAAAWAEGLARGGVLSCAKHFPGHGDTTVDSHLALPRVTRARDDLERIEIAPFRSLAKNAALASMMTAHVVYDAIDAERPATLSRAVCTNLLRGELGFDGVLFSDDLEMKAIAMPVSEAAVLAVAAGCDVLLVCSRGDLAEEAHAALVREAESSPAFRARCDEALARFTAMRARVAPAPVVDAQELARVFEGSRPVADELSRRLSSLRSEGAQ